MSASPHRLSIEVPLARDNHDMLSRHVDLQLSDDDAKVLAAVKAALIEMGATVRTYSRDEPVFGTGSAVRWLLQELGRARLERLGLSAIE